ncbi:hypothetical protein [Mycolicibacterium fallax]|uniref:Uncharacterized protein n=1 Tax=Mycolicibacterium fallax TaxID=1793 RepID=A0A1X1RL59_MYCFA|nr:hypothetical protein [Mycolicibacterium fallax]ORV08482.1 hypothetical protein AWC04_02045 [Mycolicibacterium fallax]BBZ00262.1 hypothetical protein MFAL_37280 [Mycolicibacterium fallax]HOW93318.1 hypothetical protein [Mycolicibacterium fallax]
MHRTVFCTIAAVTVVAAAPAVALADPGIPDFASYPKVTAADYTVRDGLAYSVRGFRTPSGLNCTSSQHRDMYALDCTGGLVGLPDGANWIRLRASGPVVSAPTFSTAEDRPSVEGVPQFEATPLPLLPAGQLYAFDAAQCVWTDTVALACKFASREKPDAEYTGFVATTTGTTTFGNL